MPVTDATLRAHSRAQVVVDESVDAATRALVEQWAGAWDVLAEEWDAAIRSLFDAEDAGDVALVRARVAQSERVRQALTHTDQQLRRFHTEAGVQVQTSLPATMAQQDMLFGEMIDSQLPVSLRRTWSQVSTGAIDAIVTRTTQQITSLTWPLADDVTARMKAELIRGVAVGDNPRIAAARITRAVGDAFNGGRARAENITRTEMIDAYRQGALLSRQANRGVLSHWQWLAELSHRTCPACLAMHGTIHSIDEPGPLGHPSCRCTGLPVTKPWQDLGFPGVDEPPSAVPDAKAWFDAQPGWVQRHIMGERRLAAYQAGAMNWDDMPVRRTADGWRDSYVTRRVPDSFKLPTEPKPGKATKPDVDEWLKYPHVKESMDKSVKNANPNYLTKAGYSRNCPNTTLAYDMRRRGIDAQAAPLSNGRLAIDCPKPWVDKNGNHPVRNATTGSGRDDITKAVTDMPVGARGAVDVRWKAGGGHIFNWEKTDQGIRFVDAQSGDLDASSYFERVKHGKTFWFRTDDRGLRYDDGGARGPWVRKGDSE